MQNYVILARAGATVADEWHGLGVEHQAAGRFVEARRAYDNGLRASPNHAAITANLGILWAQLGDASRACRDLERALLFDDRHPLIWQNYALALLDADREDEAARAIARGFELKATADGHHAAARIRLALGDAAGAVAAYDRSLAIDPAHKGSAFDAIYARSLADIDAHDNLVARQRFHAALAYTGSRRRHDNVRDPARPLRIGYVGGDFKVHSAAFVFGDVVLGHDRRVFQPYCYATLSLNPEDRMTRRFMAETQWRDISALDDAAAEAMIRADGIDILVDLSGHTCGSRLPIFTRKPAPVQVHAWGFATGSGCPEIDYFFADPVSVPKAERHFYAEQIWDLPALVGYMPPAEHGLAASSPPPAAANGIITFGAFGRFEKFSDASLGAWRAVLERVPGSRLFMKDGAFDRPAAIRRVRKAMAGIDPARLLFSARSPHSDHLLAFQRVDLALDTFPHAGGVTGLELVYMGVPIVTLYGRQPAARLGAVVAKIVGHEEWIATSVDDYVDRAVALAADREALAALRPTLRPALLASPICGPRYRQAVEDAYRAMWKHYCATGSARKSGEKSRAA